MAGHPSPANQMAPPGSSAAAAAAPKRTQTTRRQKVAPRLLNICVSLQWLAGLVLLGEPMEALRMINLDVPETAIQGDTHKLSCHFALHQSSQRRANNNSPPTAPPAQAVKSDRKRKPAAHWMANNNNYQHEHQQQVADGNDVQRDHDDPQTDAGQPADEQLYAVKWYKDEREFFRYLAQEWPRKQPLPLEGLDVDVDSSDNQTVVLRNVSLKTSGLFRCEVSTDAPTFVTKSIERKMHIFALPNAGPSIERLGPASNTRRPGRVQPLGEQLHFRCSSKESKPAATLDWIINDAHNLSSWLPVSQKGELIFKLDNKRLVRLPAAHHQPTAAAAAAGQTSPAYQIYQVEHQDNQATAGTVAVHQLQQQSAPGSLINMADGLLGQLLETSTSELNLTVDNNLIEFLSSEAANPLIHTNPARKQTTKLATQGSGAQMKWKKSPANNGGGRQSTTNTEFALKIKCVARILHLTMSDEIKLRLVNRTKDSLGPSDGLAQMGAQKQTKHDSSKANPGTRLIQNGNSLAGLTLLMTTTTIISIQLAWRAKIVII